MFIALLIVLLSKPGEPVVFGVIGELPNMSACATALARMDITDEERSKLACIEVKKQKEA